MMRELENRNLGLQALRGLPLTATCRAPGQARPGEGPPAESLTLDTISPEQAQPENISSAQSSLAALAILDANL